MSIQVELEKNSVK